MKRYPIAALAVAIAGILGGAAHAQKLGPIKIIRPNERPVRPIEAVKNKKATVTWLESLALLKAPTVDAFIEALPVWGAENPRLPDKNQSQSTKLPDETVDGRGYQVTRTRYSLTDTPEEIVTFQPVNGFWLGGLVQQEGMTLGIGSLQEIPVQAQKRASFKVSTNLPTGSNFRLVSQPSESAVGSALGDLMQKGNSLSWGGARTLKVVDNYNEQQASLNLGIGARYLTAKVKAALQSDRHQSRHTVTAAFIERAFTAQADFEGRTRRAAFFHDSFTIDDARDLVKQKRIANWNLPTYVKSVTYGRVVLFNLTSTLSEEKMRTTLQGSFDAVVGSANVNVATDSAMKNASFELRVTQFGGPQNGFHELVPAKGIQNVLAVMNKYLQRPAPLSSMMPISYTINTLRDDQLAAMSVTTDYTVTKYVSNSIGERYKIKMWLDVIGSDDGVADNTVECYGELRVNGDLWWQILRDESEGHKRERGQSLEISEDTGHRKREFKFDRLDGEGIPFKLNLRIMDSDGGSADDLLGTYDLTLDLQAMSKATEPAFYIWRKGKEGTRLMIKVERTELL